MEKVILLKIGELWLKGKNRNDFINRLIFNIENSTNLSKKDIKIIQGRIYIQNHNKETIFQNLKYIFGLSSFVEAYKIKDVSYEKINEPVYRLIQKMIDKGLKTFKIETNRALKTFNKNSMEVSAGIGGAVLEKFKDLSVDIKNPDFIINIDIREEGIFIYLNLQEIKSPGGLPVGISGKGLLMLSGGIDSPVAGWMMTKRGMSIDAVYFHSPPHVGDKTKEKILDICKVLASWKTASVKLFVPYFTEIQVKTSKEVDDAFWVLLHRRFMTRIAKKISDKNDYQTIITGESLGQVASQTIENIAAINYNLDTLITRPAIGLDKQEIIDLAKKIGTYDISILPYEDCCTIFAQKHPKTKAKLGSIEKLEKEFDIEKLIDGALEKMEVYEVTYDKIKKMN